MNNLKNKSGFTLIELLMVISIITLLSSVLFSYVDSARAKSRDTVRLSDMKQIGIAANLYYEDKGVLPSSIGTGGDSLVGAGYLSAEPKDPKTGNSYTFKKSGSTVVVSGNYESDNQIVAIAVGEIDTTTLCNATFASSTGCSGTTISGHIVGVTGGRRSGGGSGSSGEVVNSISGCSIEDINKTCPTIFYTKNCYCGGTIKNIDSSLQESECKTEYGLYWDILQRIIISMWPPYWSTSDFVGRCFDKVSCESNSRVWENGVCLPPAPVDAKVSCESNGNVWLASYNNNGNGVCLTQANCEDYSASPYYMHWLDNSCKQDIPSPYANEAGCLARGGSWTNYVLAYSENNSNFGAVFAAGGGRTTLPTVSSTYRCFIANMGSDNCTNSGGTVLTSGNGCYLSCFTVPKGTCLSSMCLPACVFEAE